MNYPRVIYRITHNVTNRMYIGSTGNLKMRLKTHFNRLKAHTHNIEDMQNDFDIFGDDYTVDIIGIIKNRDENRKEFNEMSRHKSRIRGIGYNYKDNQGISKKSLVLLKEAND